MNFELTWNRETLVWTFVVLVAMPSLVPSSARTLHVWSTLVAFQWLDRELSLIECLRQKWFSIKKRE